MTAQQLYKELEAGVHFEIYRAFGNALKSGYTVGDTVFKQIKPETKLPSGKKPDLVLYDSVGKPWLVIEVKRYDKEKEVESIDPYGSEVIAQASNYASELGAPFFATCNAEVFILFETYSDFVPLPDRKLKPYTIHGFDLEAFSRELMEDLVGFRKKKQEWPAEYENLIARLRYLHRVLRPQFEVSIKAKLESDPGFREECLNHLEKEGFEDSDRRTLISAEETAYLLMNKILFYKTIEKKYPGLRVLKELEIETADRELKRYFQEVMDKVDFEAVFRDRNVFNQIPVTRDIRALVKDFVQELETYDLSKIKSDILGMVYKNLIPKEEKKEFGQYYTDNDIAHIITSLCVKDPFDVVLDGACGSGTFLIEAYHHILDLKQEADPSREEEALHSEILGQLWGVEINQFPAHLTAMQLTMQNLRAKTNRLNVITNDFFRTPKRYVFHGLTKTSLSSDKEVYGQIPSADAFVRNPPYIRQEEIKDKSLVRRVALSEFREKYGKAIGSRSDYYVYFMLQGTKFLKTGGRLGYITSNSWLDVKLGSGLKQFLLDNYRITTIIAFDKDVFEDAIVNACIIIAQKEGEEEKRLENQVKFIRIKKKISKDELVRIIKKRNASFDDDQVRLRVVEQGLLSPENRWSLHHRAPLLYFRLLENDKLSRMNDETKEYVAKVSYPYKTGSNDFFILTKEQAKKWNIEKEYLRKCISSPRELNSPFIRESDLKKLIFMVGRSKRELINRGGGNGALRYINYGEKKRVLINAGKDKGKYVKGYHNVSSLKGKKIWYALEEKDPAPIYIPQQFRKRMVVYDNQRAESHSTHSLFEIRPRKKWYSPCLILFLNSSIGELFIELGGRYPGDGLLSLMVYEAEEMFVINPEKLAEKEKEQVKDLYDEFKKIENYEGLQEFKRRKLDDFWFKVLGVNDVPNKLLYESLEDLKEIRKKAKKEKSSMIKRKNSGSAPNRLLKKDSSKTPSLGRWIEK